MKNHRIVIMCCILLALAACKRAGGSDPWDGNYSDNEYKVSDAGPEDYVGDYSTVWKTLPGHFPDLTKTDATSNMCWAYAAASLLVYGGWAENMQIVVDRMLEHYGNVFNSTSTALKWYFETYLPYKYKSYYIIMERNVIDVPAFIASSIESDKPVALFLWGGNNHFVAIYGYRYNPHEDSFDFLTVQGDDTVHTIVLTVKWNGDIWEITAGYTKYNAIGNALYLLRREQTH